MQSNIESELRGLYDSNGSLDPAQVLTYAKRHKKSALWEEFNSRGMWDDKQAANVARLDFARHIIRQVEVKIISNNGNRQKVRQYVSTTAAREQPGSYQIRQQVLSSDERRQQMREDCARELTTVSRRYCDVLPAGDLRIVEGIAHRIESEESQQADAG